MDAAKPLTKFCLHFYLMRIIASQYFNWTDLPIDEGEEISKSTIYCIRKEFWEMKWKHSKYLQLQHSTGEGQMPRQVSYRGLSDLWTKGSHLPHTHFWGNTSHALAAQEWFMNPVHVRQPDSYTWSLSKTEAMVLTNSFHALCRGTLSPWHPESGQHLSRLSVERDPSVVHVCSATKFCLLQICPTFPMEVDYITLDGGLAYSAPLKATVRTKLEVP